MRLRIGTRVLLYFACVIGIVVALGVLGFTTMSRLSEELKGSLGEAFSASAELAELRLLARQARLILAASAAAGAPPPPQGGRRGAPPPPPAPPPPRPPPPPPRSGVAV